MTESSPPPYIKRPQPTPDALGLLPCDYAAIERSIARSEQDRDRLSAAGDYDAMFPEADAESLRKVLSVLRTISSARGLPPPPEFMDYMATNYRPRTIISDPLWHAPKIFRAALYAIEQALKRAKA